MRSRAAAWVGLILGTVFVIMGFAGSNPGLWRLGGVLLAIRAWANFGRGKNSS